MSQTTYLGHDSLLWSWFWIVTSRLCPSAHVIHAGNACTCRGYILLGYIQWSPLLEEPNAGHTCTYLRHFLGYACIQAAALALTIFFAKLGRWSSEAHINIFSPAEQWGFAVRVDLMAFVLVGAAVGSWVVWVLGDRRRVGDRGFWVLEIRRGRARKGNQHGRLNIEDEKHTKWVSIGLRFRVRRHNK